MDAMPATEAKDSGSFVPSHILVFGATGQIGRYITEALIRARPAFPQLTVFTSAATAAPESKRAALLEKWKAAGVSIITGDLTSAEDVAAAYRSVDTVISCVGRSVLGAQKELIRLAEESGTVRWFFPSEYGTDIEHGPDSANEKPHQLKLQVRRYIRENVKRMKVTYLVTGPYFDMWVAPFPGLEELGGFDKAKNESYLIGNGEGRIAFTTMRDTGKCLVAALRHPEASLDKALKVASFVVTPDEVRAEYEKQLGAPMKATYLPLAQMEEKEKQLWEEGSPHAALATLRRIWAQGGTLYDKWDNGDIGLKMDEDMEKMQMSIRRDIVGDTEDL